MVGDHNMEKEPHDHVKCVYVFGATSSASHPNYALRRTAVKNEAVLGKVAASALPHNLGLQLY